MPLVIAGSLQGPWQRAIHAYKYGGRRDLAPTLARPLTAAIRQAELPLTALAPVPLHPDRRRARGFNQAEHLARSVATSLDLPLLTALHRTRNTPAQVTLGEHERRLNLAGAFTWAGTHPPPQRLGLVDDVCTTGSTLLAVAAAIRAAGGEVTAFLVLAAPVFPAPGAPAGPRQQGHPPAQSFPPTPVTSPATTAGPL